MKKLLLVMFLALLTACGGGGEDSSTSSSETPALEPIDLGAVGELTGTINLEGTAPAMREIQMSADPNCSRLHTSPVQEQFVIGENGSLGNVFVYVKSGLPDRNFPVPDEPVMIDQQGCMYEPHVLGIRAGQTLIVRNSDETLHNIHAMPKNNPEFNIGQPVKGIETKKTFANAEVMVPFKCDVHKWMNSYAGVLDHPYFAVSAPNGSFNIPDLPAGDYVIEAWHERFGTQEITVTVAESATVEANFTFSMDE